MIPACLLQGCTATGAGHAATVTRALHDIAARYPGLQMPERLGGYARGADIPPLVYVETCRPQAWAAAALIRAATSKNEQGTSPWPISN